MEGGEIFVPKIPSMNIMDLAKAIAPGCQTKQVGIRPGEKLHETLIPEDEARQTWEFDDRFVIEPWWVAGGRPSGGKHVPSGFRYTSDNNSKWLTIGELQKFLKIKKTRRESRKEKRTVYSV